MHLEDNNALTAISRCNIIRVTDFCFTKSEETQREEMVFVREILYDIWVSGAGITSVALVFTIAKTFIDAKKNKKINQVLFSLISTVLSIILLLCLYVGLSSTKVPYVYGQKGSDAEKALIDSHLKCMLQPGYERKEVFDLVVMDQSEEPGTLIEKNKSVTIYFEIPSQKTETQMTVVPDVKGKNYLEAIELIEERNMKFSVYAYSVIPDTNSAFVVEQSFAPGLNIPEASVIQLWLSSDTISNDVSDVISFDEKILVPDVYGMEKQEAIDLLISTGFGTVTSSIDETGYVISQSIPAFTMVDKGLKIEIETIAKKPGSMCAVPSVIGKTQDEAVELIKASGLQFQVWWYEKDIENGNEIYIIDQSILPNSLVLAGTIVKLHLSTKK